MGATERDLLRRMQEADEITAGDAARAQELQAPDVSPGGLSPVQAKFLQAARSGAGDEFHPSDELSTTDRFFGRLQHGFLDELTLGRSEMLGEGGLDDRIVRDALNRPGADITDVADVMGRIAGAVPLALGTGAAATLTAAKGATMLATRAPALSGALRFLSTKADDSAKLWARIKRGTAQNVFQGMAYTAAAAPARRLEEGQTRARAMAEEFGTGVAADFLLGVLFSALPGGAATRNAVSRLATSDNSIDRELGTAVTRLMDDLEAEVGGPGARMGQTTRAQVLQSEDIVEAADVDAARELAINPAEETAPDRLLPGMTEAEAAGALPGVRDQQAGGPRLMPGDRLSPEQAAAREDVDVGRNRPFLSRFAGEETPRPEIRPDRLVGPESLAAESGGPILQRGEVPQPGRPGFQESVSVERNRPFMSRMVDDAAEDVGPRDLEFMEGTEQFAAPEGQSFGFDVETEGGATLSIAGRFDPETGTVHVGNVQGGRGEIGVGPIRQALRQIREQFPEATRVEGLRTTAGAARGRQVSRELRPEAELAAPGRAEPDAEAPSVAQEPEMGPEALEMPKVRSRDAQDAIQRVSEAQTTGEVFTAASDLMAAKMSRDEALSVQEFVARRLEQVGGDQRGTGVPARRRPPPEPSPAPVAAGEAPQRTRVAPRGTEVRPGVRLVPDPQQRAPRGTPERRKVARRLLSQREEIRKLKVDPLSGIVGGNQARRAVERVDTDPNQKYIGFDLTVFKSINDELGMGAGDDRIRELGRVLRQVGEEFGFDPRNLIRSGGDEFAIIVPSDMPAERIKVVGDRVVELAGELELPSGTKSGVRYGEGATHEAAQSAAAEMVAKSKRGEAAVEEVAEPPLTPLQEKLQKFGIEGRPEPLTGMLDHADELEADRWKDLSHPLNLIETYHQMAAEAPEGSSLTPLSPAIRRDRVIERVDRVYGVEVGDQIRASLGLNPIDLEPSIAEQATALRHADAAARSFTKGDDIAGVDGSPAPVSTRSGQYSATYRVVDLDDLHASHNGVTWEPDPAYYPEGAVQQRDYRRNKANQQSVVEIAQEPDFNAYFDRSSFAQTGPPTTSPDGKAIAGNGRTMALKRMQEMNPKAFEAYQQELRKRLPEFGIEGDIPENGVLVRQLDDESIDFSDVDLMRELNIEFDKAVGKAKAAVEDAASRAVVLQSDRGSKALGMLDTIEDEQTLRAWLWTGDGRKFVQELRANEFFSSEEVGAMIDTDTGNLTERGREVVTESLMVAAVGDPNIVRRAPAAMKDRIEHAIPSLIRLKGTDWDLQPVVREALEVLSDVHENPSFKGRTGKVWNMRNQTGLFEAGPSKRALDVAQTIEDGSKRDVTDAFRRYVKEERLATNQAQSDDLFGFEPKTPEKAFDEIFGEPLRIKESKQKPCQ